MIYHLSEHIVLFKSEHIPLFFVLKNSSSKLSLKLWMTVLCLNGIVSCSSSPPLRQISPLGNAFCCFEEIFLFNNLNQIRQRHYGTADNKVERSFLLFCTGMAESHIFQSDGICHFGCYTYFFCRYCLRGGILPRETGLLKECQENLLLYPSPWCWFRGGIGWFWQCLMNGARDAHINSQCPCGRYVDFWIPVSVEVV